MKYLFILIASSFLLFSCSDQPSKTSNQNGLAEVELSIEGMSCEKMCGGAICKGLEKLDGVASTDLQFSSDNPVDKVTVTFDPEKTSADEMKEKVEKLANGAYKVKEVSDL